jgi:hypothetical protein
MEQYQFLMDMICRLYGEDNCIHFKMEWMAIEYLIGEKGLIFIRASILLANFSVNVQETCIGTTSGLCMSSFLIDIVFAYVLIPDMNWKRTLKLSPIHV